MHPPCADADPPLVSAATLVETGIVMLNRHGPKGARKVNALIQEAGFQVESVTPQHAQLALAKATGLPLLFKGRDFPGTDI